MTESLRVKTLSIKNFRTFTDATLGLHEHFTVLVADNGGGKTATLDALSLALAALIPATTGRKTKRPRRGLDLEPSDATSTEVLPPYSQSNYPVQIACDGVVNEAQTSWELSLRSGMEQPQIAVPPEAAAFARRSATSTASPLDLPVVAYYGTSRATGSVVASKAPNLGRVQRNFGYSNALSPSADYSELTAWLAQTEWERTSISGSAWEPALNAIYEATSSVLAPLGVISVQYSLENRDLVVEFADPQTGDEFSLDRGHRRILPMSKVSDGFRSILAMVADLALRCNLLNAHFDAEAPLLTDGLVLIDEIDMHLHPRWQASIVGDLRRTFPRVQVVATTHSPLVVSSLEPDQVRMIKSSGSGSVFSEVTRQTKGADIEYISEAIFEAPTRGDAEVVRDLERLGEYLATGNLKDASDHAERIRSRLDLGADLEADRLLREYDWRVSRTSEGN